MYWLVHVCAKVRCERFSLKISRFHRSYIRISKETKNLPRDIALACSSRSLDVFTVFLFSLTYYSVNSVNNACFFQPFRFYDMTHFQIQFAADLSFVTCPMNSVEPPIGHEKVAYKNSATLSANLSRVKVVKPSPWLRKTRLVFLIIC